MKWTSYWRKRPTNSQHVSNPPWNWLREVNILGHSTILVPFCFISQFQNDKISSHISKLSSCLYPWTFNFPSLGSQHVTYLDLSSHLVKGREEQTNVPINCFGFLRREAGNPLLSICTHTPLLHLLSIQRPRSHSLFPAGLSRLMYIHSPLKGRTQHPVKTKSSSIHDMILFAGLKGLRSEGGRDPEDAEWGRAREGWVWSYSPLKKTALSASTVIKPTNGGRGEHDGGNLEEACWRLKYVTPIQSRWDKGIKERYRRERRDSGTRSFHGWWLIARLLIDSQCGAEGWESSGWGWCWAVRNQG